MNIVYHEFYSVLHRVVVGKYEICNIVTCIFLVSAPDIIQEDSPTVVIATDDDELSMKRKN